MKALNAFLMIQKQKTLKVYHVWKHHRTGHVFVTWFVSW